MARKILSPGNKRHFTLFFKALVSILLLAYLIEKIDVSVMLRLVSGLTVWTATMAVTLFFIHSVICAVRWQIILDVMGTRIRVLDAVRITVVGFFFNQLLPGTIGGDAIRIWECSRLGCAVSAAVHSVILERVGQLVVLSCLAAAGATLWSRGQLPAEITVPLWFICGSIIVIVSVMGVFDKLSIRWQSIFLVGRMAHFGRDLRLLFGNPNYMIMIVATVCGSQVLLALVLLSIANDLHLTITFWDSFLLLPSVLLISYIPISFGGWGVREYAMALIFGYAGVPLSGALLLSALFALASIVASLPGALFWLLQPRRSTGA